ncbi:MAG TPA: thiamine-phosphate kinase [Nitrolancea sp.]|nr:thiamine-phosphate kinase [Nitrolancea sp.]
MRIPSGGRPVKDVGEFGLIDALAAAVAGSGHDRLKHGIGDDAAVWTPRPGRDLVVTTDMLVENVHFRLDWTDWRSLGHKSLAANLSDIAAMGAIPRVALVSLGLRGSERDREIIELYQGMQGLAHPCGVSIAGGDISSSAVLTIAITVIGEGPSGCRPVMTRSAARPGDLLAVTGPVGLAAAGLRVVEQGLNVLDGNPAMREAFTRPHPRIVQGRIMARTGVRAAMDLSDGLLGDLPKICRMSGVSAVIDLPLLPVPTAVKWAFTDWTDLALRGGEDYELLFACPPPVFERVGCRFRRFRLREPIRIGEITEPGERGPVVRLRDAAGTLRDVEPGGFSHFGKA